MSGLLTLEELAELDRDEAEHEACAAARRVAGDWQGAVVSMLLAMKAGALRVLLADEHFIASAGRTISRLHGPSSLADQVSPSEFCELIFDDADSDDLLLVYATAYDFLGPSNAARNRASISAARVLLDVYFYRSRLGTMLESMRAGSVDLQQIGELIWIVGRLGARDGSLRYDVELPEALARAEREAARQEKAGKKGGARVAARADIWRKPLLPHLLEYRQTYPEATADALISEGLEEIARRAVQWVDDYLVADPAEIPERETLIDKLQNLKEDALRGRIRFWVSQGLLPPRSSRDPSGAPRR